MILRLEGVHLHTRGFTYSHLDLLNRSTQITDPTDPKYTSSEGFTYQIIVTGSVHQLVDQTFQYPEQQRHIWYVACSLQV